MAGNLAQCAACRQSKLHLARAASVCFQLDVDDKAVAAAVEMEDVSRRRLYRGDREIVAAHEGVLDESFGERRRGGHA